MDLESTGRIDDVVVKKMTSQLLHRGPDGIDHYVNGNLAYGFTRLSIIDLAGGMQPIFNEDRSLVMICNGEIFNYIELREELTQKGHRFKTHTDVEVILHLYEDMGPGFLDRLNGQFAFAIYDFKKKTLLCARDHFGIVPFFYTVADGFFIFGSEIKAILEHPAVKRQVDLVGLDQVFSFPALICPRTMFKDINSLENGHYLLVKDMDNIKNVEYWDVVYPGENDIAYRDDEQFYIERLEELISQSIKLRLRADVPVGYYISGGLDSSLVSSIATALTPDVRRYSFSIDFEEKDKSEAFYQRQMVDAIKSFHFEKQFFYSDISSRLQKAVYHSEAPLKETYNTASLAMSEAARENNIKVVLSGEGADEWFAGYPGYRFDKFRQMQNKKSAAGPAEGELNEKLWGDEGFNFEMNQYQFRKTKRDLYSEHINEIFGEIDSLQHKVVNKDRIRGRHMVHRRSYLDYKLRLVAHLISDHGDRMTYANSVEGRYPFLDKDLVEFVSQIPPDLKLNDFEEKYILKQIAKNRIPAKILNREKFSFHAPGSPYLLKRNVEYIQDILSYDTIKRQGYFHPDMVETLKKNYVSDGFTLNIPYESDLLITIITFGIFLREFNMPGMNG
jgi:asparagine synthase (glutamine-hydrolysing)